MIIWICIIAWLLLGFWSSGYEFAYFQRRWPTLAEGDFYRDRSRAQFSISLGLIAILVTLQMGHTEFGWLNPFSARRKEAV